jgi:hypothetical protein
VAGVAGDEHAGQLDVAVAFGTSSYLSQMRWPIS